MSVTQMILSLMSLYVSDLERILVRMNEAFHGTLSKSPSTQRSSARSLSNEVYIHKGGNFSFTENTAEGGLTMNVIGTREH